MKIQISLDTTKCQAYGLCVGILPEVFDVPDDSPVATLLHTTVGEEDRKDLEEAVRACPAQAIAIKVSDPAAEQD